MLDTQYISLIRVCLQNTSLLRIGDEDKNILLDEQTKKPILPASGVAGAFRDYLKKIGETQEQIDELFGGIQQEGEKSKLFLSDAYGNKTEYERRERVRIDREKGAAYDKSVFHIDYLEKGIEFELYIRCEANNKEELKIFHHLLSQCIEAIEKKEIRFGAEKTNGAGEFKLVKKEEQTFDLYNREEYICYLKDLNEDRWKPFEKCIDNRKQGYFFATIQAETKLSTPMLIAGVQDYNTEVDLCSIKTRNGQYVIPGSSLKGVLRSQCEKIADYLSISNLVNQMFGTEENQGQAGKVYVSDIIIEEQKDGVIYHRIAIDKFTGGTRKGAKFADKPVKGKIVLRISLAHFPTKNQEDAATALLLFAIRDLLSGITHLGSGFNIGRGRLEAEYLLLEQGTEKIKISLHKKEENEKINSYIKALKEYKGADTNDRAG